MPCFESVSASCVEIPAELTLHSLAGDNLEALLGSTDQQLTALTAALKTTGLILRSFTPAQGQTALSLLQALLDKDFAQDARLQSLEAKQTASSILATPTGLPAGSIAQVLTSLSAQIAALQTDIGALKAGIPASTSLYVPHT